MLDNRVIPLKRGFVGVINRGQKDIDDGVSIRQVLPPTILPPVSSVERYSLSPLGGTSSSECTVL